MGKRLKITRKDFLYTEEEERIYDSMCAKKGYDTFAIDDMQELMRLNDIAMSKDFEYTEEEWDLDDKIHERLYQIFLKHQGKI